MTVLEILLERVLGRLNHMDLELIKRINIDNFYTVAVKEMRENLDAISGQMNPKLHLTKKKSKINS